MLDDDILTFKIATSWNIFVTPTIFCLMWKFRTPQEQAVCRYYKIVCSRNICKSSFHCVKIVEKLDAIVGDEQAKWQKMGTQMLLSASK